MVKILSQGHGGSLVVTKHPYVRCDCGETFPMRRHPVEPQWESPQWEAHARQMMTLARVADVKVVGEGDGWVLR